MKRRGYLRSKSRKPDPIAALYSRTVRQDRQEHGYKVGLFDPHHLAGRLGNCKLFFAWIDRPLHDWIHAHPNSARAAGWLANINGTFSVNLPAVVRARARWEELCKMLEEKI